MNLRIFLIDRMQGRSAVALLMAGFVFGAVQLHAQANRPGGRMTVRPGSTAGSLPDAPGKETVLKVCSTCHGPGVILGAGHTRAEWGEVIASMVSRGAKASDQEFATVLNYLSTNLPPKAAAPAERKAAAAAPGNRPASLPVKAGGTMGAGSDDAHIVDAAAAQRGKAVYAAECVTCHGPKARGTAKGADLARSLVVLHDRYASTLGPFLQKGHPLQSGKQSTMLAKASVEDLAHFLHQSVYDTLRSGPNSQVINVLTGDAQAGAAYFNGAGKCTGCHSATGDLAGVAKRYDPPTLQQRFLFPQSISFSSRGVVHTKPVMVTVTPPSQPAVTGALESIDDFNVALRDSSGQYHSWERVPGLKIEKKDPYAAHVELLDQYTDKNIHDVVAYLETLK